VNTDNKPLIDNNIIGFDLNFKTIDYTIIKNNEIVETNTIDTSDIAKTQRDYARKRQKIQKHIKNTAKRNRKLKEAKHRQRNIIKDKLQKLTTEIVNNNDKIFVFEDLTNIKKKKNSNNNKSKRFRTDINRWPYRLFQRFIDYKSNNKTLYINPEGTSSECPVCGGKLEHPIWKISKCNNCGLTYDRNRLSSLSISIRGLDLCGTPFIVSGTSSWHFMKDNYMYHPDHVIIENANDCKKEMHNNA
jgi:IS605 OrfB family transposase